MSDSPFVQLPSVRTRIGRWTAELLLVFVGAYAAFWLNTWQEHQQDAHRHDQLLAALEDEVVSAIAGAKTEREGEAKKVAEFRRGLDAGEMPVVRPFSFTTDYNPADIATLLQSGGYQLLDVKTLIALRKVESVLRGGLGAIAHYERLSDQLIVPNLDQDTSFFYDPATKKLRKRFARYPDALQDCVRFFDDYITAENELLTQIHAERQRH